MLGRGKQHVFSQYPHPLAPGASKHGFGNISGTMGCAGGNGPPYVCKAVMGYSMRTPVRPSTHGALLDWNSSWNAAEASAD